MIEANQADEVDLQLFLESDVGIYLLEEKRVDEARRVLARLKGEQEV